MTTLQTLLVNLEANSAAFTKDMNQAADAVQQTTKRMDQALGGAIKTFGKMEDAVKGAAGAFAALGAVATVTALLTRASQEAGEAEKSMKALEQVVRSTGGAAGVSVKSVTDLTSALQKQTGVSDDALNAASALMLTFTKVGKQVFPDAMKVVNDMSVALGQDLKSSSIQVGKALNDPIKGVTALQRVGVSFTESQKAQIKTLVETGRALDAQKLILQELQTEFGGAAAAARDTFGGAVEALNIAVGDLFEQIGGGTNGGLRGAIEFMVIATEHATAAVGEFQEWLGSEKSAVEFREALRTTGETASVMLTVIKNGINETVDVIDKWIVKSELIQRTFVQGDFWKDALDFFVPPSLQPHLEQFLGAIPAEAKKKEADMKAAGKDYVGSLTDPISKEMARIEKESKDRLKSIQDAAKKFKGPKVNTDDVLVESDEEKKAAKEAQKNLERQAELYKQIVGSYAGHGEQMKAVTEEQKEQLRYSEAVAKIDEAAAGNKLSQLDAEVAKIHLKRDLETNLATIKEKAAKEESDDLAKLLKDMDLRAATIQAEIDGRTGITESMKLEAQLQEILKNGAGEHAEMVEKIRQKQEEILKLEEQKKHDEELKSVKEILAGYEEQSEAIIAKMNGTENLLPLLKEERKIREEMKHLSEDEKNTAIQGLRDRWSQTQALNNTLKDQEKLVDKITSGDQGYYNTVKNLEGALASNRITLSQYNEALTKLNDGQKTASKAGQEFADTVGKGLEDALFNGKKLTDVMKDLGKELAKMAIKKAFIDPLKERLGTVFDQVGRNLFGVGKQDFTTAPGAPVAPGVVAGGTNSLGVPGSPQSNQLAQLLDALNKKLVSPLSSAPLGATTQAGSVYAQGPVYINGADVAMQSPNVNNPTLKLPESTFNNTGSGGGTFGGGGILGGLLGGLGNLLKMPFNLLGSIFGGGSAGGGLLGGLGGLLFKNLSLGSGSSSSANPMLAGAMMAMGGGSQSIFGGLGGLMNPFGLLGGIGKAFGSTFGGDTIFRDVAPLFNPFGFMKGLGSAIGGLYGGARASGGPVMAGKAYMVGDGPGNMNPELFVPNSNGFIMSGADTNAIMNAGRGTPLYQQIGAGIDFTAFNQFGTPGATGMEGYELQELMRKYELLKSVGKEGYRQLGYGEWTNDEMGRMMQIMSFQNLNVKEQARQWYGDAMQAGAQAYLSGNVRGANGNDLNWAADITSNKTWANVSQAQANTFSMQMPLGNQLGNMFSKWNHRGVFAGNELMSFANSRDQLLDWLKGSTGISEWQGFGMGYNSMGMGGGMGAPNANFYESDKPETNSWGTIGSGRYTYTGVRSWGAPPPVAPNGYNQQWGSGAGYQQGWRPTGSPFSNNSLLYTGGTGVQNYTPTYFPYSNDPALNKLRDMMFRQPLNSIHYEPPNSVLNDPWFRLGGIGTGGYVSLRDQGLGDRSGYMPEMGTIDAIKRYMDAALKAWDKRDYKGPSQTDWTMRSPGGGYDGRQTLRSIDPYSGIGTGTQSSMDQYYQGLQQNVLDQMAQAGATSEQLREMRYRMTGMGGYDWTQYHVPSPFTPDSPLGAIKTIMDTFSGGTVFGDLAPLFNPMSFLGAALGAGASTMGNTFLGDIAPLFNPLGFLGGLRNAMGATMGGLVAERKQFGGPVKAMQPYVWNENGREMFMSTQPGQVLTAEQVRARGTGGGVTINLQPINNTSVAMEEPQILPPVTPGGMYRLIMNERRRAEPSIRGYRR